MPWTGVQGESEKTMARFQPDSHVEGVHPNGIRFYARFDLHVIHVAWDAGCNFEKEADGFGPGCGTHGDWSGIRDSTEEAIEKMYAKACRFLRMRGKWGDATKGLRLSKGIPGEVSNDVEVFKSFEEMSLKNDPVARAIWSLCNLGSLTDDQLKTIEHAEPSLVMNCAIEAVRRKLMEA